MFPSIGRVGRSAVGAYPALGSRNFRIYWAGMLVSLTGFWMQNLAQGWLVLKLTDRPIMLGLVGAFFAVPNILLSLVGGVYADRLDRRRLLLATRSVGAVVSLATAALIATGLIQGVLLVVFAGAPTLSIVAAVLAAVGLANAAYSTLSTTLLQTGLDEVYRGRVMSVLALAMSVMPLAGLQAGAIADVYSASLAMALNGCIVAVASALSIVLAPQLWRA